MTIQLVGLTTASFSETVSVPAMQAGDVAISILLRLWNSTVPSLPSGWTSLSSNGMRAMYKIAQEEAASGAFVSTSAQRALVAVFRGCSQTSPIGRNSVTPRVSGTELSFGALSENTPAAGLVVCAALKDRENSANTSGLEDFTEHTNNSFGLWTAEKSDFTGGIYSPGGAAQIMCAFTVSLVADAGAPERQRSRLILTPW